MLDLPDHHRLLVHSRCDAGNDSLDAIHAGQPLDADSKAVIIIPLCDIRTAVVCTCARQPVATNQGTKIASNHTTVTSEFGGQINQGSVDLYEYSYT